MLKVGLKPFFSLSVIFGENLGNCFGLSVDFLFTFFSFFQVFCHLYKNTAQVPMMQVQEIILTSMISEIITAITKLAALTGTPQPLEVQGMVKPATLSPSMTLITNLLQGTNAVLIWIADLQMADNLKTISSPNLYSLH